MSHKAPQLANCTEPLLPLSSTPPPFSFSVPFPFPFLSFLFSFYFPLGPLPFLSFPLPFSLSRLFLLMLEIKFKDLYAKILS